MANKEEAEYIPTFVYNRVVREKEELLLRYRGAMAIVDMLNKELAAAQQENEKLKQFKSTLKGIMEDG